jgi:hypothetical protein
MTLLMALNIKHICNVAFIYAISKVIINKVLISTVVVYKIYTCVQCYKTFLRIFALSQSVFPRQAF